LPFRHLLKPREEAKPVIIKQEEQLR
jgi:hypothetical protein